MITSPRTHRLHQTSALLSLTLLTGFCSLDAATKQAKPVNSEGNLGIREIGECGGSYVRIGFFDERIIMLPDESGEYRCFELQEAIESINKEFKKRQKELDQRTADLQKLYQNPEAMNDPAQTAHIMKERYSLEVDSKMLSQEYQARIVQAKTDFLPTVKDALKDVADEQELDVIETFKSDLTFVRPCADLTETVVKKLNEKYRMKQRAKKAEVAKNSAAKKEKA